MHFVSFRSGFEACFLMGFPVYYNCLNLNPFAKEEGLNGKKTTDKRADRNPLCREV
jgi:hypothetical protein